MSVRIKVTNYQSIKDADIVISGLTLLKGASNAGKSSFFKAVQSACTNRFRVGCVTFGEEATTIQIKYSDTPEYFHCTRLATGASPKIRLGTKAGGYQQFDKLNRTVPLELQKFHNFGKIKASTDDEVDVNFVSQFTPPLLCNFSPRKIIDIISSSEEMTKLFKAKKILDQANADLKGSVKILTELVAETKDKVHENTQKKKKLPPKAALLK
jgi:AAA15 family ATPase/GTPase